MGTFGLAFYNVRVGRDPAQVERELRAILTTWKPGVLGLCETTGYSLPGVDGWVKIRDTSKESRANIAAYVKAHLDLTDIQWHDLKETWTKTAQGAHGQHAPRSILEFGAGPLQVLVAHQPPKGTDNTQDAQAEGISKLEARMAPWTRDGWDDRDDDDQAAAKSKTRLVLWDANRWPGESGPGPDQLAGKIGGGVVGQKIDGSVKRKATTSGVCYQDEAGGVALKTDHEWGAFRCDLTEDG
jgi:hypothetical protein